MGSAHAARMVPSADGAAYGWSAVARSVADPSSAGGRRQIWQPRNAAVTAARAAAAGTPSRRPVARLRRCLHPQTCSICVAVVVCKRMDFGTPQQHALSTAVALTHARCCNRYHGPILFVLPGGLSIHHVHMRRRHKGGGRSSGLGTERRAGAPLGLGRAPTAECAGGAAPGARPAAPKGAGTLCMISFHEPSHCLICAYTIGQDFPDMLHQIEIRSRVTVMHHAPSSSCEAAVIC